MSLVESLLVARVVGTSHGLPFPRGHSDLFCWLGTPFPRSSSASPTARSTLLRFGLALVSLQQLSKLRSTTATASCQGVLGGATEST